MANALPEIPSNAEKEVAADARQIKYKSLKSKPGAMKRKELLINMEKERFNQNMVALHRGTEDVTSRGEVISAHETTKNKWAAIRGFIQQTIEQQPGSG